MRSRRLPLALAALTVLGALLRWVTLGDQSYWGDEGVTVALVRGSFGDMLDTIPRSESTPPLYYALAWLWTRAVGLVGRVGAALAVGPVRHADDPGGLRRRVDARDPAGRAGRGRAGRLLAAARLVLAGEPRLLAACC